jgi:hypothetical protein
MCIACGSGFRTSVIATLCHHPPGTQGNRIWISAAAFLGFCGSGRMSPPCVSQFRNRIGNLGAIFESNLCRRACSRRRCAQPSIANFHMRFPCPGTGLTYSRLSRYRPHLAVAPLAPDSMAPVTANLISTLRSLQMCVEDGKLP